MKGLDSGKQGVVHAAAAALLLWFSSSVSAQPALYVEDWEDRLVSKDGSTLDGGCYQQGAHGYNSFFVSDKHVRSGNAALRVELRGEHKNEVCTVSRLVKEGKSRSEIRHARLIDSLNNIPMGAEVWLGFSMYFPSDEGTFNSWWSKADRVIVMQLLGAGNSVTPELHFMIEGGRLVFEQTSSTAEVGENLVHVADKIPVKPDQWVDIVVHWKRSWQSDGFRRVWINGQQVIDRAGPSAIRNKPYAYFKQGAYFGTEIRPEKYVFYVDALRMGDRTSTYADVAPAAAITKPRPNSPMLTVR